MDLPIDIYHVIAAQSESTYRALLALPPFARSIDVSTRHDYMILFGYSVEISRHRIIWRKNGQIHRKDGPSIEYPDGSVMWYRRDVVHRDDGPALVYTNGFRAWYQGGLLHRWDGPAVTRLDGGEEWYYNGIKQKTSGLVHRAAAWS